MAADEQCVYNRSMVDSPSIVLFDGHCNLCHGFVVFIIRRDPRGRFKFASIQSEAGRKALAGAGRAESLESVVLIENGQVYDRSTAGLRILRSLGALWPLTCVFMVVPRMLRDAVYNWIARNRYAWFGRTAQCLLPTPEISSRFLH